MKWPIGRKSPLIELDARGVLQSTGPKEARLRRRPPPVGAIGEQQRGRPSFRERPFLSNAWLSCAGTGELAPEIG
jgi:hypothetical protein